MGIKGTPTQAAGLFGTGSAQARVCDSRSRPVARPITCSLIFKLRNGLENQDTAQRNRTGVNTLLYVHLYFHIC